MASKEHAAKEQRDDVGLEHAKKGACGGYTRLRKAATVEAALVRRHAGGGKQCAKSGALFSAPC
jgi:hypothetical protein